ncbi:MAG TPA: AsmA family protein, partial [Candidatus Eisenbacteria bacterium]
MTRRLRRILFIVGGAIGLLALVALAVPLFVHLDHYKPRFEAAATDALGMDVRIAGKLGVGLFPSFHITAEDGRLLGAQGAVVASAKRVKLSVDLFSLLRGAIRLRGIEVRQPHLRIERGPEGKFNIEGLEKSIALIGSLDGARVSVSDGVLHYADHGSGEAFEATDFDLTIRRLRIAAAKTLSPTRRVSMQASFSCARIETKGVAMSALKATISGKDGIFQVEPITVRLFGGEGAGSIRADATDSIPSYQVRFSLPGFRIEEFVKVL